MKDRDDLIVAVLQTHGTLAAGQSPRTAAPASKTRADLKTAVLQNLQTIGAGQSASAEDDALVEDNMDDVLEDLKSRGILDLGTASFFRSDIVPSLAQIVAAVLADKWGVQKIRGMDLASYQQQAEERLFRIDLANGRGYTMLDDRLDGYLAELHSRDVYKDWDVQNFDDEVFPPLASAVAALSAPEFKTQQFSGMGIEDYRMRAEHRLIRVYAKKDRGLPVVAEYF